MRDKLSARAQASLPTRAPHARDRLARGRLQAVFSVPGSMRARGRMQARLHGRLRARWNDNPYLSRRVGTFLPRK